jgi:hypothetical protein
MRRIGHEQPSEHRGEGKSIPPLLRTIITDLTFFLEIQKNMESSFDAISRQIGLSTNEIERIGKILQEKGVVELNYPVNILSKATIRLIAKLPQPIQPKITGEKLLLSYNLQANNVPALVQIWQMQDSSRPLYDLEHPQICPYTEKFLEYMRDSLAKKLPVETDEIVDQKRFALLKDRFYKAAMDMIGDELESIPEEEKKVLAGMLLHRMYGLGVIEILMADDLLEEVAINGSLEPIAVFHRAIY